jgi:hypothetical protein
LSQRKQKIKAGGLRAAQVEQLAVRGDLFGFHVVQNRFSNRWIESLLEVIFRQDVWVGVLRLFGETPVGHVRPVTAFIGYLAESLLFLKIVQALKPACITPASPGKTCGTMDG